MSIKLQQSNFKNDPCPDDFTGDSYQTFKELKKNLHQFCTTSPRKSK